MEAATTMMGSQLLFRVTLLLWSLDRSVDAWWTSDRSLAQKSSFYRYQHTESRLCSTSSSVIDDPSTVRIYSRPALYDLAFGYRDFPQEVAILMELHRLATGSTPTSVVEVAAGPARHCLALPRSIPTSYAVDTSLEMKDYSASLQMQQQQQHNNLQYLVQDMRTMELPTTVDTAWILLGSLQHMVTVADAKQCFASIHTALNANGTLIIELPHPNELFSMVDCTSNTWSVPLELSDDDSGGELNIIWGDAEDPFDPLTHIRNATVGFHLKTGGIDQEQWADVVPMKGYTVPELELLAELTGFRVVQLVGALDEIVPIDHEDLAYRLVCVLQKV